MPVTGPIIFIEDDLDDQELFAEAVQELKVPNICKFFSDGRDALTYLETTSERPFVIFCDVNMPRLNGLELRNEINNNEYLRKKSIPFVFFTTALNNKLVDKAFDLNVQGFFKKPAQYTEIKVIIKQVLDYWFKSKYPAPTLF